MSIIKTSNIGEMLSIVSPLKPAALNADDRISVISIECNVPSTTEGIGPALVASERKWLTKVALQIYIESLGLPHQLLNNHLGIALEPLVAEDKSYEYAASVHVFKGPGGPGNPSDHHKTFIRADKAGESRWRWISRPTELMPSSEAMKLLAVSAAQHKNEEGAWSTCPNLNVTFNFSIQSTTLADIVRHTEQCTVSRQTLQSRDIVNDLLGTLNSDTSVTAGHKAYDSTNRTQLRGLETLQGVARFLHTHEKELLLAEVPCDKLYFKAQSVASFMQDFLGSAALSSNTDITRVTENPLRGVEVKVLGGLGSSKQRIVGVSLQDASQLSAKPLGARADQTLAQYYSSKGVNLLTPHLPCINVGTVKAPLHIPAELCLIEPHQPFVGPLSPALQSLLATLKTSAAVVQKNDRSNIALDLIPTNPVWRAKPNQPNSTAQKSSATAVDCFKVVFVAVGSEFAGMRLFQDLAAELATKIKTYKVGIVAEQTIHLQHFEDIQSPKIWQHNLARHASDSDGRQVVFIIGYSDNAQKSATEKTLKKICDQRLGAQCLFISASDLQSAAYGKWARPMTHFASQQLSRIFACNPVGGSSEQLSVGLHVTPLSRPQSGEKLGRSSEESWYLVAFAARASDSSHDYHHDVVLKKVTAGGAFDLAALWNDFLQRILSGPNVKVGRITLFRSGAVVPLPSLLQPEAVIRNGILSHNIAPSAPSTLFNGSGTSSQSHSAQGDTFDHAETASTAATSAGSNGVDHGRKGDTHTSKPPPSTFEILGQEATCFARILEGTSASAELVYYHAAEDPSFRLPESTLTKITEETNQDTESMMGQPLLFLHDKKLLGSRDAVGVLSASKHLQKQPLMKLTIIRQANAQHLGKLSATPALHNLWQRRGFRGSVHIKRSAGRPRDLNMPQTPGRRTSALSVLDGLGSPTSSPQHAESHSLLSSPPRQSSVGSISTVKGHTPAAVTPLRDSMVVSDTELQLLNDAFHDDLLKLHNTKWPIPTYLAQKASKRAIVNMESDCWDEDIPTAPYKLHETHEKLRRTLYFLT